MGKMKYFLFSALFVFVICMAVACGRNNGTGNNTGSNGSGGATTGQSSTAAEIATTMETEDGIGESGKESEGDTGNSGESGHSENGSGENAGDSSMDKNENGSKNEETGGVLRDMVDDVEQGVNRMTE